MLSKDIKDFYQFCKGLLYTPHPLQPHTPTVMGNFMVCSGDASKRTWGVGGGGGNAYMRREREREREKEGEE